MGFSFPYRGWVQVSIFFCIEGFPFGVQCYLERAGDYERANRGATMLKKGLYNR